MFISASEDDLGLLGVTFLKVGGISARGLLTWLFNVRKS